MQAAAVISRHIVQAHSVGTTDIPAPQSSNRSVGDRAAAPNVAASHLNGSATGCQDPRTHGAQSLRRVCHGSRDSASNHSGMALERATASVCGHEMENRKIEILPLEYSTEPRFVFPRMPLTFFGPNRPNAGPTPAPLPPAYQKNPSPPMFPRMGFWAGTQGTWPPWGVGRGAKLSQPDACGRLQPLRQGL